MANNNIYKARDIDSIMEDYNKIQLANLRTVQLRREELEEKFPRLAEVNAEIKSYSLSVAKLRISRKNQPGTPEYDEIHEHLASLRAEKKQILIDNGYPEDYLDEFYDCPDCKDTGYIGTERCHCLKQKIINELYIQSNLGNVLEHENFDNFNFEYFDTKSKLENYNPRLYMQNTVEWLKNFCNEFKKDSYTGPINILLYGETGRGKTFLSNCVAKALLDKGHTVLSISANTLFTDVLQRYAAATEVTKELDALRDYVYNCDLLIIDDLGTENLTDFKASQFYEIINQRILSNKSILISTNLSTKQLQERYSERIMSRLISSYQVFYLGGEDIRYLKRRNILRGNKDDN